MKSPKDGGEMIKEGDRLTEIEVAKGSGHNEECDCGHEEEEKSESRGKVMKAQPKVA